MLSATWHCYLIYLWISFFALASLSCLHGCTMQTMFMYLWGCSLSILKHSTLQGSVFLETSLQSSAFILHLREQKCSDSIQMLSEMQRKWILVLSVAISRQPQMRPAQQLHVQVDACMGACWSVFKSSVTCQIYSCATGVIHHWADLQSPMDAVWIEQTLHCLFFVEISNCEEPLQLPALWAECAAWQTGVTQHGFHWLQMKCRSSWNKLK